MVKYYAVAEGRQPGVFESWSECQKQVHEFAGAKFKSFATNAEAMTFVRNAGTSTKVGRKQRKGDIADAPAVKKPRGRPPKRAADKAESAGAASGLRDAALNSLNSDVHASATAGVGRREDPRASACRDAGADKLPLATGVFAAAGTDRAGGEADDLMMAAAVHQLDASAAHGIDPKHTYRMVRP